MKKTITKDSGIVQLLPKQEDITLGKQGADNLHAVMYVDLEKLNSENNNKDVSLVIIDCDLEITLLVMQCSFYFICSAFKLHL